MQTNAVVHPVLGLMLAVLLLGVVGAKAFAASSEGIPSQGEVEVDGLLIPIPDLSENQAAAVEPEEGEEEVDVMTSEERRLQRIVDRQSERQNMVASPPLEEEMDHTAEGDTPPAPIHAAASVPSAAPSAPIHSAAYESTARPLPPTGMGHVWILTSSLVLAGSSWLYRRKPLI